MNLETIFHSGRFIGDCKIKAIGLFLEADPDRCYSKMVQFLESTIFQKSAYENIIDLDLDPDLINDINKFDDDLLQLSKEYKESLEEKQGIKQIKQKIFEFTEKFVNHISIWEDRICNHLRQIKTVKISTNKELNPEKLISGAQSFFEEDIWGDMEELEKMDLDDGCKCISIQAWTPAGMIIMRAIEKAIRNYYQKLTGSNPTNRNWGELLKELEETPSADANLLGYFTYLRTIRNTVQHPDARLSQTEAESFFMQAVHIFTIIHSLHLFET